MVSYVLIIHTYLPTYLIVPKCLTNLPTYIVIIYFSYLVITKCFTNSPTYMVTTYLSYHNSYLDKWMNRYDGTTYILYPLTHLNR
jgi:hypothetical protein